MADKPVDVPPASPSRPTKLLVQAGRLRCGGLSFACAIGRGGFRVDKHEGDGATPVGCFPLRRLFYRPDRHSGIDTSLPIQAIQPDDGWCDDPISADYNKLIKRPFPSSHERLWREDSIYDVIIVVGFNDAPVIAGRGSAIFLHNARPDFAHTDGCVAVAAADLIEVARHCDANTLIEMSGN